MANTVVSPNMTLPVPVVGTDPGPDWANNINACMSGIDAHDHTTGRGVPITPDGLNINDDLPMGDNNVITARSVRFFAQGAPLALSSDVGCIYESGVDLYYNDGAGNQVRITQSGSVAGATGTITGLPSGTASASYAGATFTFQSATSTPATMNVGPVVIGRVVASSKTVTLAPNAGQASDYSLTFPAALPAATNYMTMGSTGALSFNSSGVTGTGAVVQATSPTIAGATLTTPTISGATLTSAVLISATLTTPTIVSPTLSGTIVTSFGANRAVVTDGSGNMSSLPFTGLGSVVVASSSPTISSPTLTTPTITTPTFSGTPAGTITSATYSPTTTNVTGTAAAAAGFSYTRIGNRVTVFGQITGTSAASGSFIVTITVPILPTGNFSSTTDVIGVASSRAAGATDEAAVEALTGAKTAKLFFLYSASVAQPVVANISFSYSCA